MLLYLVEEEHPLKQGLKLRGQSGICRLCKVEEEHPLKQGLKHATTGDNNGIYTS